MLEALSNTPPKQFTIDEVESNYSDRHDRYVVSLIVTYGDRGDIGGVGSPAEAVAYALDLTQDAGARSTMWCVHDRLTRDTHYIEQGDVPELHLYPRTP